MIVGIGTDTVIIDRVARLVARWGDRFAQRVLGPAEYAEYLRRKGRGVAGEDRAIRYIAKRFAAKEACSKALGTGIRLGVWWRDMGVVNLPGGRPTMKLTGGALKRLESLTPAGHEARIDLSITDEYPMAQAFVVISAVPKPAP